MSIAVVFDQTLYTDTFGVYKRVPNKVNKLTTNKRLAMACVGSILIPPFNKRALDFFDGKLQAFYASDYDGTHLEITAGEYVKYFGLTVDEVNIILMTNDFLFSLKKNKNMYYLEILDINTRFTHGNGGDMFLFGLCLGANPLKWLNEMKKYEPTSGGELNIITASELAPYPTNSEVN